MKSLSTGEIAPTMITLEVVTSENAMVFKGVRLRALQDTPSAFSSTYADESQLTDTEWLNRVTQWSGKRSRTYLAMDTAGPCGIAGGFFDQDDLASRAPGVDVGGADPSPAGNRRSIGQRHRRLGPRRRRSYFALDRYEQQRWRDRVLPKPRVYDNGENRPLSQRSCSQRS